MLDYIVVGLGLAGVAFCETLEQQGKTFKVFNDASQTSSLVAAGMYNPVILKRFTMAWNAKEQLRYALPFYGRIEKKLGVPLNHPLPVFRRFASIEEQNNWFEAADQPHLSTFLSAKTHPNTNTAIHAPFGYGEVLHTGRIDTRKLLISYAEYLFDKGLLIKSSFDYKRLKLLERGVAYKSLTAKRLVFAEGYGMKQNPFFDYLPLNGTKGEYLRIKAPDLDEERAIKAGIFCIPVGNDHYLIGATYKWKDKTNEPTTESRTELLEKLRHFVKCDYEVVDQVAGIRPTVTDRRPLVGKHPAHQQLYVLNGFGSRGVLLAPMASQQLYAYSSRQEPLPPEMDISRFTQKYYSEVV